MAKAMLIIDMPKSCDKCPVHSINTFGDICCRGKDGRICLKEKPTWCPLREVPQKKEDNSVIYLERYEGYLEGWNDCVNEILGGAE